MSSRRLSLGGLRTPLSDASSHHNTARPVRNETPFKDRLAILEEWRQSRSNSHDSSFEAAAKRPRLMNDNEVALRAAPTASSATEDSGSTSALERFRMRKQQQHLLINTSQNHDSSFSTVSQRHNNNNDTSVCLEGSPTSRATTILSQRRRGLDSGARRLSMMPLTTSNKRKSILPHHPHNPRQHYSEEESGTVDSMGAAASSRIGRRMSIVDIPTRRSQTQTTLSQLTVEESSSSSQVPGSNGESEVDIVEGAGLRSQIREMIQRIEQLEKEKMELSMANAPLEARFRQKEDAWLKEQNRMALEIESLKVAACEADERFRDLHIKYEAAVVEVKQLRLELRKASSSINNATVSAFSNSSAWSKQLQNDRDVTELKEKLKASAFDLETARLEKVSVEKELHAVNLELESKARNLEELQYEYNEIVKSTSDKRDAEIQLEVLTIEHVATSAQLNAVCADLAATKARAEATLEAKEKEHKKVVERLQFDLSVLKSRASKIFQNASKERPEEEDEAILKARIEERDRRIAELEAEVLRGEELRRQMHNRLQELRGNVRVFVRTRPFLPNDKQHNDPAIDASPDGESLSILDARSNSRHLFKFDKVFPPSSGQDLIFQEVADFVQSALDGYQVCLFSYGQTGSGKTHTMQGSGNGVMRGIIPRAVEQILMQAKVMQKQRWDFKLSASFLEIYNEELKDLLTLMSQHNSISSKLTIKRGINGKSYVEGLTEVPIETVNSEEGMMQLEALMSVAARARSVASTNMNAHSSRSHSVFQLHIHGYNHESQAEVQGSLNLCDLAGSERLDRSGANNDAKRLKETQAINKSLSSLGDVFTALAQRASHVPYRNSKLTYLLQDCLSGDGKALMFVNLSPTTASSSESLCSLRFAQRVNQVELGKPTKNIQYKR